MMKIAEILTIVLFYQHSAYKTFKDFYLIEIPKYKSYFPNLLSYTRFIALKPRTITYLMLLLKFRMELVNKEDIFFIDSTVLKVTKDLYKLKAKHFQGIATKGKSTKGYFIGLKMHLVINRNGELVNVNFSSGNVDDRNPIPILVNNLKGTLVGDKGYISKIIKEDLALKGLKVLTPAKKNMKQKPLSKQEQTPLRKRSLIESAFSYLKNSLQLEHTRHRSLGNFVVHVLSCLVRYSGICKKPPMRSAFECA